MASPFTSAVRFVTRHALKFMFTGMAIAGISFFLFMRYRYAYQMRTLFFGFAVAGLVIYFIGRISYAYSRRMKDRAERTGTGTEDTEGSEDPR